MTLAEKDWRNGMQPHSHKKHKSIFFLCGWRWRREATEWTRKMDDRTLRQWSLPSTNDI